MFTVFEVGNRWYRFLWISIPAPIHTWPPVNGSSTWPFRASYIEVVCVFQRGVGVRGPEPKVTVELKHVISSSFWSFRYFLCSVPDNSHFLIFPTQIWHTVSQLLWLCSGMQLFFYAVFFLASLSSCIFSMMKTLYSDYTVCHFNGAVIHQESWELHWKKGTNVPIESESHMVKHSIPLWQKKSHDQLSVFSEHRDWVFLYMWRRASKSVALHGQLHLTSHLSQTPPILSCSFQFPMIASPSF